VNGVHAMGGMVIFGFCARHYYNAGVHTRMTIMSVVCF